MSFGPDTLTEVTAAPTRWDVIVVGAGPAGSLAALELARRRRQVLLVDRATFPRSKVCGGCLSMTGMARLSEAGLGPLLGRLHAIPLTRFRWYVNGSEVELELPGGCSLSRARLDDALVRAAQEEGVRFRPATTAALGEVTSSDREVLLQSQGGSSRTRARVVVVATGLGQPSRRLPQGGERVDPGSLLGGGWTGTVASSYYREGVIYMVHTPEGYVGLVRVESGMLNVAAALRAQAVRRHGGLGLAIASILSGAGLPSLTCPRPSDWKGTPRLTRRLTRVASDRLFVIGDAAGYVEPFTGEGMGWALTDARQVTPLVDAGVTCWSPALATHWQHCHQAAAKRRRRLCWLLTRALRSRHVSQALARGLTLCPQLAAPVVRRVFGTRFGSSLSAIR